MAVLFPRTALLQSATRMQHEAAAYSEAARYFAAGAAISEEFRESAIHFQHRAASAAAMARNSLFLVLEFDAREREA